MKISAPNPEAIGVTTLDENQLVKFSYLDLFAGCGGLSVGLEAAGGRLVAAVEKSPMAGETFFHNLIRPADSAASWVEHTRKTVLEQIKSGLVVDEVISVLDNQSAVDFLAGRKVDVIAGGPPCQGFSLAGRRNPSDARNSLPWQFLEMVGLLKPKMVVIENVVGMRHKFDGDKDPVFSQLSEALEDTGDGYIVQQVEVNALHYGAPQHRPRLMLIGLSRDIAKTKGFHSSQSLWKSQFIDEIHGEIPPLAPRPTIKKQEARTVRDALGGINKGLPKNFDYLKEINSLLEGELQGPEEPKNHMPRKHQPSTIERFRLYQACTANNLDVRKLVQVWGSDEPSLGDNVTKLAETFPLPLFAPDGTKLANDVVGLINLINRTRTLKHSQRVLSFDTPARTVVTIGDDYVHPVEPRTFTVRELARFQGFPDAFEFKAKETTGGLNRRNEVPQYSQVGNAVSPLLAKAVGEMIGRLLG